MKKLLMIIGFVAALSINACALEIGQEVPGFKLEKIGGGAVSLSDLKRGGSVVVLSFFDVNCKPCIKEIPQLNSLFNKYISASNVKLRMVALDDNKDKVKEFIKKYNVKVPVLCDPGGWKAGSNYGVVSGGRAEIPQIFVIGKGGKLRKHLKGYHEDVGQVLTQTIESLKKETVKKDKIDQLTIIYTNSANGHLESCDCPENPFGGLVRRMTAIERLKKAYPGALALDTGDNFSIRESELLAEYVFKMMKMIGYNAVAIGDQEFIMGADFLEKNINRLPYISANITRCDDKTCWDVAPGYKIIESNGMKVAVISIINPDIFVLFPKDKVKGVEFEGHIDTLKEMVPNLKKQADVVIVLSHSGDEEDKKIAAAVPGIDVIVGGHSQTLHKEPFKTGDMFIVQAGKDGHRVGRLSIKYDNNKKVKSFDHEMVLLIKDVPDHPAGSKLIEEYKARLKKDTEKILMD
ncbi:redoxin domain-containing protein [Elusimicrobiota bacterium]